ncbi:MAG: hypothetical protein AB7T63_17535 [Planctomycetota bacterium]
MDRLRGAPSTSACGSCGYALGPEDPVCGLCGALPGVRAPAPRTGPSPQRPPVLGTWSTPQPRPAAAPRQAVWLTLLVGFALAPLFAATPLLQRMGWFLVSLVHETGHVAISWFFGQAAVPAIRLDGHAAAVHGEQATVFVVAITAGLVWLTWALRRQRVLCAVVGVVTLLYPWLALGRAKEVLFLLGGHLGEIAFGSVFLWRARGDGFTGSRAERITYAATGAYLVGQTMVLCVGLMTSHAARAKYASNGSFGLTNDLLRLAHDHLLKPLPFVAGIVLVVAIAGATFALFWPRKAEA